MQDFTNRLASANISTRDRNIVCLLQEAIGHMDKGNFGDVIANIIIAQELILPAPEPVIANPVKMDELLYDKKYQAMSQEELLNIISHRMYKDDKAIIPGDTDKDKSQFLFHAWRMPKREVHNG